MDPPMEWQNATHPRFDDQGTAFPEGQLPGTARGRCTIRGKATGAERSQRPRLEAADRTKPTTNPGEARPPAPNEAKLQSDDVKACAVGRSGSRGKSAERSQRPWGRSRRVA
jgi:hypothetical protein